MLSVLAGAFGSCKDDPVTPPMPTRHIAVTGPSTGVADYDYEFKATVDFTDPKAPTFVWKVGDSVVQSSQYPKCMLRFSAAGFHTFSVAAIDTRTRDTLCSTTDTFVVSNVTLTITPASLDTETYSRILFHGSFSSGSIGVSDRLVWKIDSVLVERTGTDTLTWDFLGAVGTHRVQCIAYSGDSVALGVATATVTIHAPSSNDTSRHDFRWSEYQLPTTYVNEDNATACWVFAPDNILVCNWYLYKFDGHGFTKFRLTNTVGGEVGALSGSKLFCFTPEDFWISVGGAVYRWNGSVAEQTRLENTGVWQYPGDGVMNALWGASSKDMFFVGDKGTILHYDGTNWIKYPKVTDQKLLSVWGTSHNDVWACGYDQTLGTTALLHFDGVSWSRDSLGDLPAPTTGGMYAVWSIDSSSHRIAYVNGGLFFRQRDNGGWVSDSGAQTGTDIALDWLTGNSANDILLAGGWGLVVHWNGRSWKRYDEIYAPSALGYTAHAANMKGNTACVVGMKNGTSWIAIGQR